MSALEKKGREIRLERLKILHRYIQNNRIAEYEDILAKARDHGYQMLTLENYAKGDYDKGKKVLLLRHDVDHISPGTRAMLNAEQKYGATASYYFRWSTADYFLMKDIIAGGGEGSLHFETIANFLRRQQGKRYSKEDVLVRKDFFLELLKHELALFRAYYDVPCQTLASHGAEENSMVGVSNNYLTDDDSVYGDLGIVLESYQQKFIESMGIYISDTVMEYNGGYRYGITPQEAIADGISPILFLSHPNHWKYTHRGQFRKIVKSIIKSPIRTKENFKRIAK